MSDCLSEFCRNFTESIKIQIMQNSHNLDKFPSVAESCVGFAVCLNVGLGESELVGVLCHCTCVGVIVDLLVVRCSWLGLYYCQRLQR